MLAPITIRDVEKRKILWLAMAGAAPGTMMISLVSPALPTIAAEWGGDETAIKLSQLMVTIPGLGGIVGALLGGWIVQRLGAMNAILTSLIIYGLLGASGFFLIDKFAMLTSRALLGVTSTVLYVGLFTLIGDQFDDIERGKVIGYKFAFGQVITVIAVLLAGSLIKNFDWHVTFLLYPAVVLLVLPLWFLAIGGVHNKAVVANKSPRAPEIIISIVPLWRWFTLGFFAQVIALVPLTQFSFLLAEYGVKSPRWLALVAALFSVGMTIGGGMYGMLAKRLTPVRTFILASALAVVAFGSVAMTSNALIIGMASFMLGWVTGVYLPYIGHGVLTAAPVQVRALALGPYTCAIYTGALLSPMLIAPFRVLLGTRVTFGLIAIVIAVSIAIWTHLSKSR
jgi:MFS family permease